MTEKPIKNNTELVGLAVGATLGFVFKWLTMTYISIQILTYMGAI